MKTKKIYLSENEKKHIKSLYGIIQEQTNNQYGVCNGNNNVNDPTINVSISEDLTQASFNLTAFFGASVTSEQAYENVLTGLKNNVLSRLGQNASTEDYSLEIFQIDRAVGSASNYYDGPVPPTNGNDGNVLSNTQLKQEPYTQIQASENNINNNNNLASERLNTLINFINSSQLGIQLSSDLNITNSTSRITDTGGCTDETRDISNYPNPGQYVFVEGKLRISSGSDVINCIRGMKVIVGYFNSDTTVDGIEFPKNKDEHKCDFATFTVFANGQEIGISNMNNNKSVNDQETENINIGTQDSGTQQRRAPQEVGDTVYTIMQIPNDILDQIANNSEDGKIKLTMRGTEGSATRSQKVFYTNTKDGKSELGTQQAVHGSAPMVCVFRDRTDGTKELLYGPNEPYQEKGDVPSTAQLSIGTFEPCNPQQ